ncbi:hypothetical protein BLA29_011878 [Euroglyphus maynei]|uniref:Uncharacterized protein n=1 Tax=Euroglyphus maynei TaxID=6958 RepID=A0A1Y3AYH6_EURMA|nr:hypothetical protein BLA29_011878 [Euroglyphus maynei]
MFLDPADVYIHSNAPAVNYASNEKYGGSSDGGYGKRSLSNGAGYGGMTSSYTKLSSPSYSNGGSSVCVV